MVAHGCPFDRGSGETCTILLTYRELQRKEDFVGELVSLDLVPELTPRVATYFAQLEDVRRDTKKYVSRLTPAQLSWTPHSKVESIGTQLLHIAGVERSWIGEDIEGRAMGNEWELAFPLRTNFPQVQGEPLEFFFEKLDAVREETRAVLSGLKDADLSREIQGLGSAADSDRFTIEWILYHLVEHEAHHRGQIALLKRLLPDF